MKYRKNHMGSKLNHLQLFLQGSLDSKYPVIISYLSGKKCSYLMQLGMFYSHNCTPHIFDLLLHEYQ